MKVKLFFAMPFLLALSGCGGGKSETTPEVKPEQASNPVLQSTQENLEKLVNPEPILALSQVGAVNNTPQFIRAQKVALPFPNGRPHRELTIHLYRNGPNRFHGPYKEWYPDGTLWKEGLYEENNRVGEWKWYAENGELAKHAFYNQMGEADGSWAYFHDDGTKRRIESFKDGKRHGLTDYYSNDGTQLLENFSFKDDQLDGEVIRWFPLKENQTEPLRQNHSTYLKGKRHGVATEWYEDGQIRNKVEFKNGNRHGRTQRWDTDGNIELDLLFEGGEPVDPGAILNEESDTTQPAVDEDGESQSSDTPPNGGPASTKAKP